MSEEAAPYDRARTYAKAANTHSPRPTTSGPIRLRRSSSPSPSGCRGFWRRARKGNSAMALEPSGAPSRSAMRASRGNWMILIPWRPRVLKLAGSTTLCAMRRRRSGCLMPSWMADPPILFGWFCSKIISPIANPRALSSDRWMIRITWSVSFAHGATITSWRFRDHERTETIALDVVHLPADRRAGIKRDVAALCDQSRAEARAYLDHAVLGPRLLAVSRRCLVSRVGRWSKSSDSR